MDNLDIDYYEATEQYWNERTPEESMHMNEHLQSIADEIINRLKSVGFQILRYDAYTTNSIYLKLDYGVCNSIRISDHEGKHHLNYRYNLIDGVTNAHTKIDKYARYYYPLDMYMFMIDRIIADRNDKVMKFGANNYASYMEKNKLAHKNDRGFWSSAKLV